MMSPRANRAELMRIIRICIIRRGLWPWLWLRGPPLLPYHTRQAGSHFLGDYPNQCTRSYLSDHPRMTLLLALRVSGLQKARERQQSGGRLRGIRSRRVCHMKPFRKYARLRAISCRFRRGCQRSKAKGQACVFVCFAWCVCMGEREISVKPFQNRPKHRRGCQ